MSGSEYGLFTYVYSEGYTYLKSRIYINKLFSESLKLYRDPCSLWVWGNYISERLATCGKDVGLFHMGTEVSF